MRGLRMHRAIARASASGETTRRETERSPVFRTMDVAVVVAMIFWARQCDASSDDVNIWTLRATERVDLDSRPPNDTLHLSQGEVQQQQSKLDFAAQRGERERAVVALRSDGADLTNVTVTFAGCQRTGMAVERNNSTARPWLTAFRQGFVFVNHTGMLGITNTTPGYHADPLLPVAANGMELVPAGRTQPILILLTVPTDAGPGNYTATCVIAGWRGAAAFSVSVSVAVLVWSIDLPSVSDPSAMGTVFNFIDNVCAPYIGSNCTVGTPIHSAYLDLLATRRIPATDFPNCAVKTPADVAAYIRSGSRHIVLQDVSQNCWNNTGAATECGGGGSKFGVDYMCYSRAYVRDMVQSLSWQLGNLSAIGYGPAQQPHVNFIAYGFDERMTAAPGEADPTLGVRQLFGAVKDHFGDQLTTMTTGFGWRETGKFPPLDLPLDVMVELYYDYCWDDIQTTSWPPSIAANNSEKIRCELWRQARTEWEKNHTLWLYNACSPGACGATAHSGEMDWLNFAYIDWLPINGRLLFWLPAKLNVSGWLYWADNVWQKPAEKKCPYEICIVQPINGTMLMDDGYDHNGGGDGVLFYPGTAGPLSSIRLENIADGLEDFELFRRIKNITRRDQLITKLVQSGDLWTNDAELLETTRREAAVLVMAQHTAKTTE